MTKVRGKAFWEQLVKEVEAGGSQLRVAKQHGVSASWLRELCRRGRDEKSRSIRVRNERTRLLPVRIVEDRPRRLDLTIGPVRISFEEGTNPSYLAALVRSLSS